MKLRWLLNRNIGKALLWTVLLLVLAVAANILAIRLLGGIDSWQHWLSAAAGYFLIWRLCLYAATIYGWRWMRRRLLAREAGIEAKRRLIRAEVAAVIAIVVLMFAGMPFIDIDLNTIKYDQARSTQCQVNVPEPANTGWNQSLSTLNNQGAKVPIWWAFMHALSRAITGASVAAIPCGTDLWQIRMDINATHIDDPILAQEVSDFTHDCYGPARAKLFMQRPELDDKQMHDTRWIGSHYFTDTSGYYDNYRSQTPRDAWPYDDTLRSVRT